MQDRTELINPASLGKHPGYSHGIKVRAEYFLFVAGQVGWDEQQRIVSPDFGDQFGKALENVLTVVRAAGGKPENIARLTIYVADRNEYLANLSAIGDAYRRQMGKYYPAMTAIEVSGFVEAGARLELEATAWL
jgi:enamine deaminase RidA (YjgF/YER057c/UK114 family)